MTEVEELKKTIVDAMVIAIKYKEFDGAHHKDWVIDQMMRKLAGGAYTEIIRAAKTGEDGANTYEWNEGIAP